MQEEITISQHIKLRAANPNCADEKYDAAMRSRKQLLPWLPWVHFYDNADASAMREYQQSKAEEFKTGENYTYDIFYDDTYAGCIEIMHISQQNRHCEIGYWLATDMTKRGIMTEAVNTITELAFSKLNMHRVVILAATENKASRAVAERCGFVFEASLRDEHWLEDRFYDTAVYAKLSEK